MSNTGDYYVMPPGRMLQLPPCRGLMGRVFGHKFQARCNSKQDYPPGTVEALRDSLARVVVDPLHAAWETVDSVCEGYRCMDISQDDYLHDICVRCGLVVDRPRSVTPTRSETLPQAAQPQAAVTPSAAPAGPQPSVIPQRVVAVPANIKVVSGGLGQANVPPGAPGSPVKAVPGRGPKV